MRKSYETQRDREREIEVARECARAWRCVAYRRPDNARVDFRLMEPGSRSRVVVFMEIKVRENAMRDYPTLMLSARKWRALLTFSRIAAIGSVLVVRWTDCTCYAPVVEELPTRVGGRRDRGDPLDVEQVVDVPLGFFTPV